MHFRVFGLRLHEIAVLVAGVLVAVYAAWVIRDVSAPAVTSSTSSGSPSSPSPSVSVDPPQAPATPPGLGQFRKAAAKTKTLLVIGDSTGAGPGAWVDLLAQDLAKKRAVTLHQWDDLAQQFAPTPTVFGSGRALAIWNLSYPGVKADYAEHLDEVADRPGAVILNIGHDRDRRALGRTVRTTTAGIDKRWGDVRIAWVLQNPSTGAAAKMQEAAVDRLTALATEKRVPVIDVHSEFRTRGNFARLLSDDSHPSVAGSRLWADVVGRALAANAQ